MEGKSEADKEAVKKISKYASKELVRQIKEKLIDEFEYSLIH